MVHVEFVVVSVRSLSLELGGDRHQVQLKVVRKEDVRTVQALLRRNGCHRRFRVDAANEKQGVVLERVCREQRFASRVPSHHKAAVIGALALRRQNALRDGREGLVFDDGAKVSEEMDEVVVGGQLVVDDVADVEHTLPCGLHFDPLGIDIRDEQESVGVATAFLIRVGSEQCEERVISGVNPKLLQNASLFVSVTTCESV